MLTNMVQEMNEAFKLTQTSLKFEMHEKLNDYYVKIIDDTTKEVIREI
ncbi:flagellar protein FlaG [Niallia nealsonii]|nr:flagellar protein FlaG [Niallia nealsonii]